MRYSSEAIKKAATALSGQAIPIGVEPAICQCLEALDKAEQELGHLRIVIDFAEGADPDTVRKLAHRLEGWTSSEGFAYGAQAPRVEGLDD